MRIFVGLSYNRDHETEVAGAADSREDVRRIVELHRGHAVHFAREGTDGPDGGIGLDDAGGDMIGRILAFDVGGAAKLRWGIDAEMGHLTAPSICCDDGQPLLYTVWGDGDDWTADFDGKDFAHGTLEECMAACRKSEDESILSAVQRQADEASHGLAVQMLRRLLDPEDCGRAVSAYVRDEVRAVLGMPRCEHARAGK